MVKAAKSDPSLQMRVAEFHVVGRAAPTEKDKEPKIYRMRVFARNEVLAKSKFWFFMKRINKAKKSVGEILMCEKISAGSGNCVKNYAVWLRYDSRTATHNVYKEYRDVTRNGAISQMYSEMAGRHRALSCNIQIIRIAELPASLCKKATTTRFHSSKLKLPMIKCLPLAPKHLRSQFNGNRPKTFRR